MNNPTSRQTSPGHIAREGAAVVQRRPTRADRDPARHRRRTRRQERALAVGVPIALLALWQIASSSEWIDPRFFPPLTRIWSAGLKLVEQGTLQDYLAVSLRRLALGYVLGSVSGIFMGIVLSMSRLVRAALEPVIYAFYAVPKLALLPLLLLVFGIGETPLVILIVINCFFLVFIPTLAALLTVPFAYREAATSFRATRWEMLRHVSFPAALPQIFVALRITAGASILILVAMEFVQGSSGIGYLIWNSWSLFLADRMYVGIVIVALLGSLFTMAIGALGRRVCPWSREG